jgi:putative redox protein
VTARHIARAHGSTSSTWAQWRVDLESGSHALAADEPKAGGGEDAGPSPFGLVASGLTACTAMTLRMYAERKGWALAFLDVAISYDVDDEGHATFVRTVTLPADLGPEQQARLAEIAEKTPVTKALRQGTPIATTFATRAG